MANNGASSSSSGIDVLSSVNNGEGYVGSSSSSKADNFTKMLLQDLDFVGESFEAVKLKASQVASQVNEARNKLEMLMLQPHEDTQGRYSKLQQLKREVSKLKLSIPFNLITPDEKSDPHLNRRPRSKPDQVKEISFHDMIMRNWDFRYDWTPQSSVQLSHTFLEMEARLEGLSDLEISCLMCFLAFPPNATIKRSIIFRWLNAIEYYDGVSFTNCDIGRIRDVLDAVIARGFVQPLHKKASLTVGDYWMHPSDHFNLGRHRWQKPVVVGRELMILGDSIGKEDDDIFYSETSARYTKWIWMHILHLGKWKRSTTQHIEVIDPDFFLRHESLCGELRYLSLRGISMIQELPLFITKLNKLMILDLNSCYNLEVIPPEIANLSNTLTQLDMSECYFLDHMPKALAALSKLQVLKGFNVSKRVDQDSCTIEDLVSLQELIKLNIYTNVNGFPNESQLKALEELESLRNLTISWGGCSARDETWKSSPKLDLPTRESATKGARLRKLLTTKKSTLRDKTSSFSFKVEKLDLQCVPETATLGWLKPANFENLKRLYIRGGKFNDLDQPPLEVISNWNVEILRLKHLKELKLDWDELRRIFPKLICLENVNCPKLEGFPCDEDGVWMKKNAQ